MSLNFTANDDAGGQYHRANKVIFNNPVSAKDNPAHRSVLFILEQVTNTADGGRVTNEAGFINAVINDDERGQEVELIDLEGNVLGAIPLGELTDKTLLFINSFMIHTAGNQNRLL